MLRLQLLGGFRAFVDREELSALAKQPRRAALLVYVAVERKVARSRVIQALWPDVEPERGRHSLNQAIYYLRRIIGADWIELRGDDCIVAPWVGTDVDELEKAAAAGDHAGVLELYDGPLLAGTLLAETVDFDVWLDRRRAAIDRLHRRARRQQLSDLVAAGRTHDALQCAEEWCRLDPLEDEAQHRYMELLASIGQRGAALRQFSVYERLLHEYGLEPLDETKTLVEQLQHGEIAALRTAQTGPPSVDAWTRADVADAQLPAAADVAPRTHAQRVAVQLRGTDWLLHTRRGLAALLAGVFIFNLVETTFETWLAIAAEGVGVRLSRVVMIPLPLCVRPGGSLPPGRGHGEPGRR
jgi:DNA-binding SARP family transcriptional activator